MKLKTSPGNVDNSLLSEEEYTRQRLELLKEKARMEELLGDAGHRVEQSVRLAEKTFEFATNVRARFAEGDARTKKEILLTIGSNLTLKDKKLLIEARKPFLILEKSKLPDEERNQPIEPEYVPQPHRQKEANASLCPRLLAVFQSGDFFPRHARETFS